MRVSGELTVTGHRYLAALLDVIVAADCEEVVVHLAGVDMVDTRLLDVLRAARTRLQGRLTVIADRPEAGFRLRLVGLGRANSSTGDRLSAGTDHAWH